MSLRSSQTVLALFALFIAPALAAVPPLTPRVVPPKGAYVIAQDTADVPRIVIKFQEGTHVRVRNGQLKQLVDEQDASERQAMQARGLHNQQVQSELQAVMGLIQLHPQVQGLQRLFSAPEQLLATQRRTGEQRSGKELADLDLYVELALLPGTQHGAVRSLVAQLDAMVSVETAYAEPMASPAAVDIAPPSPALVTEQRYLRPAPLGIDADYAWTKRGGNGTNVRIVDVEGGWRTSHEDLPALFHTGGTQIADLHWRDHGTAVLGTMVGVANAYGVSGIAHGAQAGYESIGSQSTASGIESAARAAGDGGVVLIELHAAGPDDGTPCACNPGQCKYIAMEYWQATFDVISQATSNGTTVVEAAGNGTANLDSAIYHDLFNRNFRDSGAVLVGAASDAGRAPMCWTNYGNRVDVHGWGESVVTLGYGSRFNAGGDEDQYYTATFNGTSSASPIVTGSVACIQGAMQGAGRFPLSPVAIRDLLVTTGTPQSPDSRNIGPRPNLRAAFNKLRL